MRKMAYCRVSTREQNLDRQIEAMKKIGIPYENIYSDFMSGKDFNRKNYKKMIKNLQAGDLLVIKSIDRLGRNYAEILEQWRFITSEKKAYIQVIDMPLLNTKTELENLTGTFIADLVLQILAYVAEMERTFIKHRQAEGIAIAKKKGVKFGRPRIKSPDDFLDIISLVENNEMKRTDAIKKCGFSESTYYRRIRDVKQV